MPSELTVIIKDSEKTLRKKFLAYDKYCVDRDDPYIKDCIEDTIKDFQADPEKINLKITMLIE